MFGMENAGLALGLIHSKLSFVQHFLDSLFQRMFMFEVELGGSHFVEVLQVGRPAQEMRVVFDTGSGNLVLPAAECLDITHI